ncbi:glycosyltransferase [Micromonospora sp. BRA006-A]|nr:glycosyltransferase [Micromonospora sp. BRA006-A]
MLVPVYRPGDRLPPLVGDLRDALPGADVLVVDDGSGPAAAEVLDAARARGATVLRRRVNRERGVVLRTGFRYASTHHPGRDVICVDADGQHGVPDVCAVADRMCASGAPTLGVRAFDGEVPARSRFGNAATRWRSAWRPAGTYATPRPACAPTRPRCSAGSPRSRVTASSTR